MKEVALLYISHAGEESLGLKSLLDFSTGNLRMMILGGINKEPKLHQPMRIRLY